MVTKGMVLRLGPEKGHFMPLEGRSGEESDASLSKGPGGDNRCKRQREGQRKLKEYAVAAAAEEDKALSRSG
jgi:hypothetical protein